MTLFERAYPTFVSGLGSVGLGFAIAYLLGVVLLFVPGWEAWEAFYLAWGPILVAVPGGMLIAYLYLRTHLGAWFLQRGLVSEAIEYTSERLEHGLVRSRKETLYHRIYLARAKVVEGAYTEALEVLSQGYAVPRSGREAATIRRWELEVALRIEDAGRILEAYEAGVDADPPASTRAALNAGRAEWAVLEGSAEAYHTCIERARWADETHARVDLAEGFGAVRFGRTSGDFEQGLEALDRCRAVAQQEVPGRAPEVEAVRAELFWRLTRYEEAREVFERAGEIEEADERSRRRIEHVQRKFEESSD